jgi:hypothetical protein
MPQVHYVAHAAQRYEMVPLLDRTGKQITTEISRKTKGGATVIRRQTVTDKTKPLPNRKCDRCGTEIKTGDPYKWIAPRSGPYGGFKRFRCGRCPAWQVWEYSDSLSAQLARVSHDFWDAVSSADSPDDVRHALEEAAGEIRDIAEAKRESAENIEQGFGHSTSLSEELAQVADDLESWADEVESANVPELPEPEEGDELTEDELDAWRDEVSGEVSIIDEGPC